MTSRNTLAPIKDGSLYRTTRRRTRRDTSVLRSDYLFQLPGHLPEQGLRRGLPVDGGDIGDELQQAHALLLGHLAEHGQEVGVAAGQSQHQVRGVHRHMVVVGPHGGDQLPVQIVQQQGGIAVGHQAGGTAGHAIQDVGAPAAVDTESLGDGSDQRAEEDDGNAAATCNDGAYGSDQIADQLGRTGRLAEAHDAAADLLKGPAGVQDLQHQEQQHHIEDQGHHTAHAGGDRAAGGEHDGEADGAQHQVQDHAGQVADNQGGHQVPAQPHQDHHDHRQDQEHQGREGGAVQINGGGDSGTAAEADDHKEDGRDGGRDGSVGEPGPDHTAQIRLLGEGGANSRIGDGSQVIAEDGTTDNGAAHQAGVDVQTKGQRQQHRRHSGDGAGGGAAGGGDQHASQEGDEGNETGVQLQLGHHID